MAGLQPHAGIAGDAADCLFVYRTLCYLSHLRDGGDGQLVDGLERTDDEDGEPLSHVFSLQSRRVLARLGRELLTGYDVLQRSHRHAFGLTGRRLAQIFPSQRVANEGR